MKVKKIISIIGAITLFSTFVDVAQINTTNQVYAASFAERNHLRPYIIPKRFRGTWRRSKKDVIRITKRTIGSSSALTYYYKNKLKPNSSGASKILFIQRNGKELIYFTPYACGMGMYRSGKNLVFEAMGQKLGIYHRVK
ncbi:MAG: hypothetical protein N4R38_07045 [Lactobacillus crispatus]|nr:hypothetical protein [Lactobacillus crispatus]